MSALAAGDATWQHKALRCACTELRSASRMMLYSAAGLWYTCDTSGRSHSDLSCTRVCWAVGALGLGGVNGCLHLPCSLLQPTRTGCLIRTESLSRWPQLGRFLLDWMRMKCLFPFRSQVSSGSNALTYLLVCSCRGSVAWLKEKGLFPHRTLVSCGISALSCLLGCRCTGHQWVG